MPFSGARITWRKSPAQLAQDVEKYGKDRRKAIKEAGDQIASEAEAYMKANAPWTDQTGQARANLKATAEQTAVDEVQIVLTHGVSYGIHLEFGRAGRYAIIGPTMQAIAPRVKALLQSIVD